MENRLQEVQLQTAFIDGLGLDPEFSAWDTLQYRKIPEWDSVAHMQLIGEIEDVFDIMLDTEDVIAMSSYLVAKEILVKYEVSFE